MKAAQVLKLESASDGAAKAAAGQSKGPCESVSACPSRYIRYKCEDDVKPDLKCEVIVGS